jgi:hypothetical protein
MNAPQEIRTYRAQMSAVVPTRLQRVSAITVDGSLDDWKEKAAFAPLKEPFASSFGEGKNTLKNYSGRADLKARYSLAQNDSLLFIAIDVLDDKVNAQKGVDPWFQDGLELRIDAREPAVRNSYFSTWDDIEQILVLAISPSHHADSLWIYETEWSTVPEGISAACVRNAKGYRAEIAIPISLLAEKSGGSFSGIRFNMAIDDLDGEEPSQLWLFPDWRTEENIPGMGTFLPAPKPKPVPTVTPASAPADSAAVPAPSQQ